MSGCPCFSSICRGGLALGTMRYPLYPFPQNICAVLPHWLVLHSCHPHSNALIRSTFVGVTIYTAHLTLAGDLLATAVLKQRWQRMATCIWWMMSLLSCWSRSLTTIRIRCIEPSWRHRAGSSRWSCSGCGRVGSVVLKCLLGAPGTLVAFANVCTPLLASLLGLIRRVLAPNNQHHCRCALPTSVQF